MFGAEGTINGQVLFGLLLLSPYGREEPQLVHMPRPRSEPKVGAAAEINPSDLTPTGVVRGASICHT